VGFTPFGEAFWIDRTNPTGHGIASRLLLEGKGKACMAQQGFLCLEVCLEAGPRVGEFLLDKTKQTREGICFNAF